MPHHQFIYYLTFFYLATFILGCRSIACGDKNARKKPIIWGIGGMLLSAFSLIVTMIGPPQRLGGSFVMGRPYDESTFPAPGEDTYYLTLATGFLLNLLWLAISVFLFSSLLKMPKTPIKK